MTTPITQHHREIPTLTPVSIEVADVSDASAFPNIAEAIAWARQGKVANDG